MPDPFGGVDKLILVGFDGQQYVLHKSTWDFKVSKPERAHVEHNFHKIVETIRSPDEVRQSEKVATCFVAYKKFEFYWIRPGISAPNPPGLSYFAVVGDTKSRVIKTFYPVRRLKKGKKLWP